MAVTFGTVQVIPAGNTNSAPAPAASAGGQPMPPPDPRSLAPALRHLQERAARVRAH
jgi:hypothetical protein